MLGREKWFDSLVAVGFKNLDQVLALPPVALGAMVGEQNNIAGVEQFLQDVKNWKAMTAKRQEEEQLKYLRKMEEIDTDITYTAFVLSRVVSAPSPEQEMAREVSVRCKVDKCAVTRLSEEKLRVAFARTANELYVAFYLSRLRPLMGRSNSGELEAKQPLLGAVLYEVEDELRKERDLSVVFCGHSQGGVVAQCVATDPSIVPLLTERRQKVSVITFGAYHGYALHGERLEKLKRESKGPVQLADISGKLDSLPTLLSCVYSEGELSDDDLLEKLSKCQVVDVSEARGSAQDREWIKQWVIKHEAGLQEQCGRFSGVGVYTIDSTIDMATGHARLQKEYITLSKVARRNVGELVHVAETLDEHKLFGKFGENLRKWLDRGESRMRLKWDKEWVPSIEDSDIVVNGHEDRSVILIRGKKLFLSKSFAVQGRAFLASQVEIGSSVIQLESKAKGSELRGKVLTWHSFYDEDVRKHTLTEVHESVRRQSVKMNDFSVKDLFLKSVAFYMALKPQRGGKFEPDMKEARRGYEEAIKDIERQIPAECILLACCRLKESDGNFTLPERLKEALRAQAYQPTEELMEAMNKSHKDHMAKLHLRELRERLMEEYGSNLLQDESSAKNYGYGKRGSMLEQLVLRRQYGEMDVDKRMTDVAAMALDIFSTGRKWVWPRNAWLEGNTLKKAGGVMSSPFVTVGAGFAYMFGLFGGTKNAAHRVQKMYRATAYAAAYDSLQKVESWKDRLLLMGGFARAGQEGAESQGKELFQSISRLEEEACKVMQLENLLWEGSARMVEGWKTVASRCTELRKKLENYEGIGFLGTTQVGKSTLIGKMFGFDTHAHDEEVEGGEKRGTSYAKAYAVGGSSDVFVIDLPGVDELTTAAKASTELGRNIVTLFVVVVDWMRIADHQVNLLLELQRQRVPFIVTANWLNKSDDVVACLGDATRLSQMIEQKRNYVKDRLRKGKLVIPEKDLFLCAFHDCSPQERKRYTDAKCYGPEFILAVLKERLPRLKF